MSLTASSWVRERKASGRQPGYIFGCFRGRWWVRERQAPTIIAPTPPAELSALASGILGENGVRRFREFRSYHTGWDFGKGQVLSLKSLSQLETFLARCSEFRRRPSLFFTQSGNLMLGWEDAADNTIELEFTPDGYVLFLAATDEETEFSSEGLDSLLEMLSQADANGAP